MARTRQSTSRSQSLRDRRDQQKRQPARTAPAGRGTFSNDLPPVMVRGSSSVVTQARKPGRKAKTVKRRFDVALSTPGVEIRLPSLPAVHLGWRLASFGLVAGLIALLSYLWNSPTYLVQMAEVQGAIRLTSQEINRTLNIFNQSIFTLDPGQLEEALRFAYPELKEVSVQVGLPADVKVIVNERVPLIDWRQESTSQWVDAEGFAFQPRGEAESLVPVLAYAAPAISTQIESEEAPLGSIAAPKAFLPTDLVEAILTLSPQAPEGEALVYDSTHGLGWHDGRGWDVYFGMEVADLQEKLLVYSAIVEDLQSEGITPALINVEYVHAPFYRMER